MMNTSVTPINTSHEVAEDESVPPQAAAAKLMWQVISPILIAVGTIGNILSIIVLLRKNIRASGLSRYLICLAVADLLVLYTGLLPQWVVHTFDTNTHDRVSFICRISLWMVYFSLDLSAWILVSGVMERVISVWKPFEVKSIITRKVFVVNIVVLVVLLLVINGHFMVGSDVVGSEAEDQECDASLNAEYEHFRNQIFPWIDLCLFCLGPFLCHLVGNTLIIIGLIRAARTMDGFSLENTTHASNRRQQVISSMTMLMLCMNVIYLVCTLPISVFFIHVAIYSPDPDADLFLWYTIVHLLMYLNNSINFITYMVSGRRFRAELCALFSRKSLKPGPSLGLSISRASLANSQTLAMSFTASVR